VVQTRTHVHVQKQPLPAAGASHVVHVQSAGCSLNIGEPPHPAGGLCGNALFSDEHGEIGKAAHVSPSHPVDVFLPCSSLKVLTQIYIPSLAAAATFACSCYHFNHKFELPLIFFECSTNWDSSSPEAVAGVLHWRIWRHATANQPVPQVGKSLFYHISPFRVTLREKCCILGNRKAKLSPPRKFKGSECADTSFLTMLPRD